MANEQVAPNLFSIISRDEFLLGYILFASIIFLLALVIVLKPVRRAEFKLDTKKDISLVGVKDVLTQKILSKKKFYGMVIVFAIIGVVLTLYRIFTSVNIFAEIRSFSTLATVVVILRMMYYSVNGYFQEIRIYSTGISYYPGLKKIFKNPPDIVRFDEFDTIVSVKSKSAFSTEAYYYYFMKYNEKKNDNEVLMVIKADDFNNIKSFENSFSDSDPYISNIERNDKEVVKIPTKNYIGVIAILLILIAVGLILYFGISWGN